MTQQYLDQLPIVVIFIAVVVLGLLCYELGFRIGRWRQARTPDIEEEGPSGVLVGSLLALLAFLLAVTMGMASDRFDTRRRLVLEEANAIGTTYLRAGYLPGTATDRSRELLREYVPLRIVTDPDPAALAPAIERSIAILGELWVIAEELARTASSDVLAAYIESLNETIELHETRVTAGVYARVPETVILLLLGGSLLTLGMVGYSAGHTGRRSPVNALVLILALGAVLTLVIDLDRPAEGFIRVSQQPLIDLQEQIGAPSSE
jgi:hypothetical protein